MKKLTATLLALCMVLSLVFAGCSSSALTVKKVEQDPITYLNQGMELAMAPWKINSEKLDKLFKADNMKIDMDINVTDYKFQNTLNIDKGVILDTLTGSMDGEDMDLTVYYGNNEIAVGSEAFLGEDVLGLNLNTLVEQGEDSPLAQMLGLDEETISALKEALNAVSDTNAKSLGDRIQELNNKMMADLMANVSVAEEKITLDGAEVDTITLTVPIDNDVMQKYISDLFAEFADMLGTVADTVGMEDVTEAVKDGKFAGTYVYYLNKKTGALVQTKTDMEVTADGETSKIAGNVTYATEPAKIVVDVKTTDADGETTTVNMTVDYKLDGTKAAYGVDMKMDIPGEDSVTVTGSFTYDVAAKDYSLDLKVNADGEDSVLQVKGTAALEDNAATVTVSSLKADDVTLDTDITLKLTAGAANVTKPAYTDLNSMSEDELSDLMMAVLYGDMDFDEDMDFEGDELETEYEIDDTVCQICGKNEVTTQTTYLGTEFNVCDECAEMLAGDFCDMCGKDTSDLTPMDLGEFEVRLCDDCLASMN